MLALPRRPGQLGPQDLRHVDLDDDLALEVTAGVEVEVGVGGASEAIEARMCASSIRINGVSERHLRLLRHPVEGALRHDLVEADVERLGGVERPDDRLVAVPRQPAGGVSVGGERVPSHERMFAHVPDASAQMGEAAESLRTPLQPSLTIRRPGGACRASCPTPRSNNRSFAEP